VRFRRGLALASAVYALGAVGGYAFPFQGLLEGLSSSVEVTFWSLFSHNMIAMLAIYAASTVYLGLALVLLNGYVLGTAVAVALDAGLEPVHVAAAILPHGVVEVPAFLAASALGMETPGRLRRGGRAGLARVARGLAALTAAIAVAAAVEARAPAVNCCPVLR